EGEILGQVRAAYEAGQTGPQLDRLFRQALHVGKKVRTQTAIAESPASVSAAAAALAQQVFGDLDGREILVIGAGKVSEQAARDLEPAIHELDGCYLYDIDDLQAVVSETMAARRSEAERAEAIVLEEADEFRAWQASLDVVPAIASLRARAEEIRESELEKAR